MNMAEQFHMVSKHLSANTAHDTLKKKIQQYCCSGIFLRYHSSWLWTSLKQQTWPLRFFPPRLLIRCLSLYFKVPQHCSMLQVQYELWLYFNIAQHCSMLLVWTIIVNLFHQNLKHNTEKPGECHGISTKPRGRKVSVVNYINYFAKPGLGPSLLGRKGHPAWLWRDMCRNAAYCHFICICFHKHVHNMDVTK